MNDKVKQIVSQYSNIESILGYNKLTGGTRHFGYYPNQRADISEREAVLEMEQLAIKTLSLKEGDMVLEAGCGQGTMACRIAKQVGCYVVGITIVPQEQEKAEALAQKLNVEDKTQFLIEDFTHTSFDDNHFDKIYMMESIQHSYMLYQTVYEMHRLLKPNGKIAVFDYSIAPDEQIKSTLSEEEYSNFQESLKRVVELSSLFALPELRHGTLPTIMQEAGFRNVTHEELDDYVRPSFERIYKLASSIYPLVKTFNLQKKFRHTTVVAELIGWALKHPDLFHYNLTTGEK